MNSAMNILNRLQRVITQFQMRISIVASAVTLKLIGKQIDTVSYLRGKQIVILEI